MNAAAKVYIHSSQAMSEIPDGTAPLIFEFPDFEAMKPCCGALDSVYQEEIPKMCKWCTELAEDSPDLCLTCRNDFGRWHP